MLRCDICNGLKQVMGGGMLMKKCENCGGKGVVPVKTITDEIVKIQTPVQLNMRQTPEYKSANQRLRASRPELSLKERRKILDAELDKVLKESEEKENIANV